MSFNVQSFLCTSIQLHIYMSQFPLFFSPLAGSLLFIFMSPYTYLAPSSCDRNRPPPSQVACELTPFAPPFTQLSHPFQIPGTPTAQRLTTSTSGIFRLLLSGTQLAQTFIMYTNTGCIYMAHSPCFPISLCSFPLLPLLPLLPFVPLSTYLEPS
jgi:hypothetical protein